MAVQADTNIGFKGTVQTATWAQMAGKGVRYAVLGAGDLEVRVGTGDRGIRVMAGSAWGDGILSTFDSATNLQANPVVSGTRWDTVVIRRTWSPESNPTGTARLMVLSGTSQRAISSNRKNQPGTEQADQPIALVRVASNSTQVQQVIDLRVLCGETGVPIAFAEEALQYLDGVGSHVTIGRETWVRTINSSGSPAWTTARMEGIALFDRAGAMPGQGVSVPAPSSNFLMQAGSWSGSLNNQGNARINFPTPFPNGLLTMTASYVALSGHPKDRILTVNPPGTTDPSRTGCTVGLYDVSAPSQVNGLFARINYIAIGW